MSSRVDKLVGRIKRLMNKPERIRDIGIVAHIDHGKTTLTDNLLADAGMISEDLAGQQLFMDFYEPEKERGITINAANVSLVHTYNEEEYLINLIDTPGHIDFGGDVTRAMRAVDGAVVVVDAVEGVMPQTETVLRQALRENVKPILFINKVDRLINELQLDRDKMQIQLGKIIDETNELIKAMRKDLYENWRISVNDGSVAFGSALHKWAINVPSMRRTNIGFNEVYEFCRDDRMDDLAKKSPLYEVLLDMVISHLPNPLDAQHNRTSVIWHGDSDSRVGTSMMNCDPNGAVAFMVTDISMDPHAGEIATGRLFSGTLRKGQKLQVSGSYKEERAQQVGIFMGPNRVEVEEVPAGNIASVTGIKKAIVGSTLYTEEMMPFEEVKYESEPVVTIAVEAKSPKDLPKLIEVLRGISKEDPNVHVEINEETGEHLVSGMGELHLEITAYRIEHDKHVPIKTSKPIVVYRETIRKNGGPIEGISPNRHNRFYIEVETLGDDIVSLTKSKDLTKMDELERRELLIDAGMPKDEAKNLVDIYESNIFLDMTKGVLYMREVIEFILEGFRDICKKGPLAMEKCQGIKVKLIDVKLHEDSIHRGPAQVIPAIRRAISEAIVKADPTMLEPKQYVFIHVPQELMGNVTKDLQGRRGEILDIRTEGDMTVIKSKAPVAEMFGFASDIRSATEGRALWSTEHAGFESLPESLYEPVIKQIRARKGLEPEIPR